LATTASKVALTARAMVSSPAPPLIRADALGGTDARLLARRRSRLFRRFAGQVLQVQLKNDGVNAEPQQDRGHPPCYWDQLMSCPNDWMSLVAVVVAVGPDPGTFVAVPHTRGCAAQRLVSDASALRRTRS
jgi:hypothetical protein